MAYDGRQGYQSHAITTTLARMVLARMVVVPDGLSVIKRSYTQ